MANLLSHPFALKPNGSFAVRDESSDEYLAERLAIVMSTVPGERATVPLFGIDDPAYSRLVLPALQVQTELFGIPIRVIDVVSNVISDEQTNYYVQFEREDIDDDG